MCSCNHSGSPQRPPDGLWNQQAWWWNSSWCLSEDILERLQLCWRRPARKDRQLIFLYFRLNSQISQIKGCNPKLNASPRHFEGGPVSKAPTNVALKSAFYFLGNEYNDLHRFRYNEWKKHFQKVTNTCLTLTYLNKLQMYRSTFTLTSFQTCKSFIHLRNTN